MELKAENISYKYINSRQILKDFSISIPQGKVIGLMGDSGSGKSTLSKIIAGYINKYDGSVSIDDKPIVTKNFYPVQLIFQHPEKTMNPKWKMRRVLEESWLPPQEVIDEFGIKTDWYGRFPSELSGGELQRFSILRALNPQTKFIIADEITTMLDAVTQVQIWTSFGKYCREKNIGVLAVSHDQDLLDVICDEIIYFNEVNNL